MMHHIHSRCRLSRPTLIAIVVLIVGSVLGTGALAAGVSYLQTFDGTPATPQPLRPLIDWDVTVHSRDIATWYAPEAMQGQHGSDCAAPPAVHPVSSYEDTVFICNGHVMTALYAEGYGVIYLTPNQLVDFSTGEATIRFDVSTARTSPRDWIDLWISPYDQHLQLPLEDWLPDLNGPPRNAIHIRMDNTSAASPSGSMFRTVVYRNFVGQEVSTNNVSALENVVTPSAVVRSTFQLTISRTHLKFGMPAQNLWWMDGDIPDLGWMQGVVQLGHHSYNPAKCDPQVACSPNTWHWDNVQLSSAVPFTILRGDQRYVDPTTSPQVTFPAPAPQNARLRFAGVGNNLAVSFDGGATWQAAQLQAQEKQDVATFQSYWTPIPAGTTSVQVRGQGGWWGSQWMVRDISLWAASGSTTGLLGDLNGDGIVDIRDYGIWRQSFGTAGCGLPGDLNGDCLVDIRDYGIWRQGFGATSGAAARALSGVLPAPGALGSTPIPSSTPVRMPMPASVATPTQTPTPLSSATPIRTPTPTPTPVRRAVGLADPHS